MRKESLLAQLNDKQQEAVLHQTGPMLVTAGPGSGKTHVITSRLIYMIDVEKIPAEKIAVITFTKDAAKSMRSRFLNAFQQNENVSFGTFHSFYYQILRSSAKYSKYRLLHENEKKYILSKLINLPEEDKEQLIESLIKTISYYKNTLDQENAVKNEKMDLEQFLYYFQMYEKEKMSGKSMDFDDMLYLCMRLLENDEMLLQKWQQRFEYYLIDEFQDCNMVQYRILCLLAVKKNLFVVGDDDQSIYGFRGAKAQIMRRFIEDHPDAKMVNLGVNYRCAAKIVKASDLVICENKERIQKCLSAQRTEQADEYVKVIPWKNKSEMFKYFKHLFVKKSESELSEHALLFRTNQEMQIFAIEFTQSNIPFQMRNANASIYDHFIVKDILAFMEAAEGNQKREIFLRIFNKPKGWVSREAFSDEIVDLNQVAAFYKSPYMYNEMAVEEVTQMQNHLVRMKNMPMALRIKYIRNALRYETYLKKRAKGNEALFSSWIELLDWLQEDILGTMNIKEWKEKIAEFESRRRNDELREKIEKQGIQLLTMHASKGLEFEHCYIMNVNDGVFPKYQKGEKLSQDQIEEERRLFYVGMTRAKKTLELHYLTGTKERPKLPSRFIRKLLK